MSEKKTTREQIQSEPTWATYAALDYGFINLFVWLLIQVDPHGVNIRVLDEYYEQGRTELCRR